MAMKYKPTKTVPYSN